MTLARAVHRMGDQQNAQRGPNAGSPPNDNYQGGYGGGGQASKNGCDHD